MSSIEKLNELLEDEEVEPQKVALAKFLDVDVNDIEKMDYDYYNLPQYKLKNDNSKEYAVSSSEDETWQACYDEIESVMDDVGVLQALNWDNLGGIENYLEEDWFREAWEEMNQSYVEDIIYEGNNRFKEELEERGFNPADYGYNEEDDTFEDEEGAKEVFLDSMMDDLEESGLVQEFIAQLGEESLNHAIETGANLDMNKVVDEVVNLDGAGHLLSGYDGEEHEEEIDGNTYYIYRL